MMKKIKPTKHNLTVLNQLCKWIPINMVPKLAKEYGIDKQSRSFTPWSHVVSLLYAQLTHALSLNDICDALRHHAAKLGAIRQAVAPARNTFSNANRTRNSKMMQQLFWKTYEHLQNQFPTFARSGRYSQLPRRFKRTIHAADSSTMSLVANCIDWAKHRRRKAAAKMHLRLNLQTFLPSFVIVEEASHHDSIRAAELCADLKAGEIVVMDKAYVDFRHLFRLAQRGVFWVLRAKDNMSYRVYRKNLRKPFGKILRDDIIHLRTPKSRKEYPEALRLVRALVEVDGKKVEMEFITNNFDWAPSSICDLYRCRWGIEAFFKQLKQTLQLGDFLGHNKEAIQWQVWAALLLYLLLRFYAFMSRWSHSFNRIITLTRGVTWDRYDLLELLNFYGTAGSNFRMRCSTQQLYLPGFR